jgi:hypothetical protein
MSAGLRNAVLTGVAIAAFLRGWPLVTLGLAAIAVARMSVTALLLACAIHCGFSFAMNAHIRADPTTGMHCDYDRLMSKLHGGAVAQIDPEEIKGEWWVRATTDPMVNPASQCNRLMFWVGAETFGYNWLSHLSLGDSLPWLHVSSPARGALSTDPQRPGQMMHQSEQFPVLPQVVELIPALVVNTTRDRSGALQGFEMVDCIQGMGEFAYNQFWRRGADWSQSNAQAEDTLSKVSIPGLNTTHMKFFDFNPAVCDSRQGYLFLHFDGSILSLVALAFASAAVGSIRMLQRLCRRVSGSKAQKMD